MNYATNRTGTYIPSTARYREDGCLQQLKRFTILSIFRSKLDYERNNSNNNKFYERTKSYILLFTLVVGMPFFNLHFGQCNEKKHIGLFMHNFLI